MKLLDLLYEKNICLSIPHCQIFLHRIQIWNKDASALPEKKIRLQFFIAEAFSATLFCPVPKFQQFCKPQIIKFISCSKTDQKKGNAHLFFICTSVVSWLPPDGRFRPPGGSILSLIQTGRGAVRSSPRWRCPPSPSPAPPHGPSVPAAAFYPASAPAPAG